MLKNSLKLFVSIVTLTVHVTAFSQTQAIERSDAKPVTAKSGCACVGFASNFPGFFLVHTDLSGNSSVLKKYFSGNPPTEENLQRDYASCQELRSILQTFKICLEDTLK